jgi:hypothetical protein
VEPLEVEPDEEPDALPVEPAPLLPEVLPDEEPALEALAWPPLLPPLAEVPLLPAPPPLHAESPATPARVRAKHRRFMDFPAGN